MSLSKAQALEQNSINYRFVEQFSPGWTDLRRIWSRKRRHPVAVRRISCNTSERFLVQSVLSRYDLPRCFPITLPAVYPLESVCETLVGPLLCSAKRGIRLS